MKTCMAYLKIIEDTLLPSDFVILLLFIYKFVL